MIVKVYVIFTTAYDTVSLKEYELDVSSPSDLFGQTKTLVQEQFTLSDIVQIKYEFQATKNQILNAQAVPYVLANSIEQ